MYEFIGLRKDDFGNEVYKVKHKPLIPFIFKEKIIEYVYTKQIYRYSGEFVFYSLENFKLVDWYSHLTSYLTKIRRKQIYEQKGIVN